MACTPTLLEHVKIGDTWYWKCNYPDCGKLLAPHKKLNGHKGVFQNMQSKGAASRHLMMHDKNLVKHGQTLGDVTYKFHKFKLTDNEKINLLKTKSIQTERKGLKYSEYLAVDQKGNPIGRIHVTNEIMLTYKKYPNQNVMDPEHMILTITFVPDGMRKNKNRKQKRNREEVI